MLFFGHIGITVFIGAFLFLPYLFVGISSLLPDFIDKGLLLLGLSNYTRLYAHNVFFGPIVSLVVYAITKRKDISLAVLFGSYLHLVEDVRTPVPWLWPFVNYNLTPATGIKVAADMFDIFLEAIGLSLLVILFVFEKNIMLVRERMLVRAKDFYDKRFAKKI